MTDHEALTVPCDYCGALIGEQCINRDVLPSGLVRPEWSHRARWDRLHPGVPLTSLRWPAEPDYGDYEEAPPEENFWDDRTTPQAYGRSDSERDERIRRDAMTAPDQSSSVSRVQAGGDA